MSSRDSDRQESEMEEQVKDQAPEYERPRVVDYGTLVDITRASNQLNSDSPQGVPDTAFPVNP